MPTSEGDDDDLPIGDNLAIERTRLASDRTLMAWIRTALSLVTLGISLYKARQLLCRREVCGPGGLLGPRSYALAMIGIALVALTLALSQHVRGERLLRGRGGLRTPHYVAIVVAVLMLLLGAAAFVVVVQRW